jgi:large repetitive protein
MRLLVLAALAALLAVASASPAAAIDINVDRQPPDATVGEPYSFQLTGEEGCMASYKFVVGPGQPFPPGLTLGEKGLISGIPTAAGRYSFFVRLTDDCSFVGSEGEFTIIVAPRLEITSPAVIAPPLGQQFSTQLTASGGGTQEWAVVEGTLPDNVTLSRTGLLSGVIFAPGARVVTVQVSDPKRKGTQRLVVGQSTLSLDEPKLPTGIVLGRYSATLTATAGLVPYEFAIAEGKLPGGLALDPATGVVSGTPRQAGTFPLSVTVSDLTGATKTAETTLTIAKRLRVMRPTAAPGKVGAPFTLRFTARGGIGAKTWTVTKGELPAGLELDARTGVVSGRPTSPGRTPVVVTVTDSAGNLDRWWVPLRVRR